jgi:hypothetical protein
MAFLANLVGSEHIERYIPVAEARNERDLSAKTAEHDAKTAEHDAKTVEHAADNTAQHPTLSVTATREMPKFSGAKRVPPPQATSQVARNERKSTAAIAKPAPKAPAKQPPKKPTAQPERAGPAESAKEQVIADATRLVQWGRKWFELPELIARMADRPALPDVRRILKENKVAIEKKVGNV